MAIPSKDSPVWQWWKASDERDLLRMPPRNPLGVLLRRPSVYDWREIQEHPPGAFMVHPEPYEWFDPFVGRAMPPPSPSAALEVTRSFYVFR